MQKKEEKKTTFLPYFFFRPLQETNNIFFLCQDSMSKICNFGVLGLLSLKYPWMDKLNCLNIQRALEIQTILHVFQRIPRVLQFSFNPFMPEVPKIAWQFWRHRSHKSLFCKIFQGEMFIWTLPKTFHSILFNNYYHRSRCHVSRSPGMNGLTLPMLRLLSSKTKIFENHLIIPCHVGIHWKALVEYSQMSTHLPGFTSFSRFLASFWIAQIIHQQHKG